MHDDFCRDAFASARPDDAPRLVYTPLPHQQRFHDALDPRCGPALRMGALIAGYGAGKTIAGAAEALRQAVANPGAPVLCVSPTYPQARETSFACVARLLDDARVPYTARFSDAHEIAVPAWNARLVWVGAERPQAMKGIDAAGVWLDEPGLMPEHGPSGEPLFTTAVARARAPRAHSRRVWLTGTPEGLNWLYETIVLKPPAGLTVVHASTLDNPHLGSEYARAVADGRPEALVRALVGGEFVDVSRGRVYEAFRHTAHTAPAGLDPDRPYLLTFDFNRDPLHVLAAQRAGGVLHVVKEWVVADTTTYEAARRVRADLLPTPSRAEVCVYGDPAGRWGSVRDRRSDYDQIVEALGDAVGPVRVCARRAHPPVAARVRAVNRAFAHDRLFIDPGCRTLIRDLMQVRWRPGTTEIDKSDPRLTHASDALGYLVFEQAAPAPVSIVDADADE